MWFEFKMDKILLNDLNSLVKCEKIVIPITKDFNYACFIYFKIQKKQKLYLYIISENNCINMVPYINTIINYIAAHTKINKKNISFVRGENNCYVLNFKVHKHKNLNFTNYLINNKPIKTNAISMNVDINNINALSLIEYINKYGIINIFVDYTLLNRKMFYKYIKYKSITKNFSIKINIYLILKELNYE